MKKFALIEFIISLILAIVSFVLSIIYKDAMVATIIAATITIVTIINVLNIFRDVSNKASLDEQITSLENKAISVKAYFHINELEKLEREFCHSNKNARVYVISNNLTKDGSQFLDEIKRNIKKGISYYYVVPIELKSAANKIKTDALNGNEGLKEYFHIGTADFSLCPAKYAVVIYDNPESDYDEQKLRGFCCAQDLIVDKDIYYRELSRENTKKIRDETNEIFVMAEQEELAV